MKYTLFGTLLLFLAVAVYGLLYLYAYRYKDLDKISGYSALSGLYLDELPQDDSLLGIILKPAARFHQQRLTRDCADTLNGVWKLDDEDEFKSLLPVIIELRHVSNNRITIRPSIDSEGKEIHEFTVSRLISNEFPTTIHTGTTVMMTMQTEDKIRLLTREMDPFGLGAQYNRQQ